MLKQLLFSLLCVAGLALPASAQMYGFQPNDTVYVFGDKINVREAASPDAKAITQLTIGEMLVVTEISENQSTVNGVALPWYKVRYNGRQQGYVWAGVVSATGMSQAGDTRFFGGVTKQIKAGSPDGDAAEYQYEIRAAKNGSIVSKVSCNIPSEGFVRGRDLEPNARGLQGYTALLGMTVSYDACGAPWHDWYVLWNGKQLVQLPLCTSISDAGAFSHVESYVFPEGTGEYEPGHYGDAAKLYFSIEHSDRNEQEDGSWDEDSWVRARAMKWNGSAWTKPKNMGEPKQ